jgi:hypothetical protein
MLQQFKNMNELVVYLSGLEERVKCLEEENSRLRANPGGGGSVDERTIAKLVATFLPLTNIVHPSFLKRAFAVWGHFFVANFIISLPLIILQICLMMTIYGDMSRSTYP